MACLVIAVALGHHPDAGEPAQVSTPSNRKGPADLPNRKKQPSFHSLDGSSMGGVMDGKASESIPQVDPVLPDARKQLELFERLDKKRNFLLTDPSNGNGKRETGSFDKGDNETGETLSVGPRKPRTALERRLRGDAEAARNPSTRNSSTEDNRNPSERQYAEKDKMRETTDRDDRGEKREEDREDSRDNEKSGETADLTQSFQRQLDPEKGNSLEQRLSKAGVSPGIKMGSEPDTRPDNLRSGSSNHGGRGSLVDDLSRQRLERYQQVTGSGSLLRSGETPESPAFGRGREMRVDAFGPVGISPAASRPGGGLATPATGGTVLDLRASRPGLASPSSTFSLPTPSTGSSLLSPPPSASSTRMLRDSRPAPPRFQP